MLAQTEQADHNKKVATIHTVKNVTWYNKYMTLLSVYHTYFGVIATSTVLYIMPMVWYLHFIFYSEWQYCREVKNILTSSFNTKHNKVGFRH